MTEVDTTATEVAGSVVESAMEEEAPIPSVPPQPKGRVAWWPFIAYAAMWAGLSVSVVLTLKDLPTSQVYTEAAHYGLIVLGGTALVALGPLVALVAWLAARRRTAEGEREGLLVSALLRGSLVGLAGAAGWWGAIGILDYLRLGRF